MKLAAFIAGVLLLVGTTAAIAQGYPLPNRSALAQGPAVRKDLPYDPLRDFTLIGFLGVLPGSVAVHTDVPARTVAELVAYARANPDKLSYGTAGIGSAGHFQAEYFMSATGARFFHVPFKSDNDAARELSSGVVQVALNTALPVLTLAPTGKVRVLAITSPRRLARLADVPIVAELGMPGLEGLVPYSFLGFVGPAGMPGGITEQLGEAVNRVAGQPEVIAQLRDAYLLETRPGTPAEFRKFIETEIAKWRDLGRTVKLTE